MKLGTALMALAIVCILVAPAFSAPAGNGASKVQHYGMQLLADNLTAEELNNMTLAQIKELKQKEMQKLNNMTPAQIKELKQQARNNTTFGEAREWKQMRNGDGSWRLGRNDSDQKGAFYGNGRGFAGGPSLFILTDDLTVDKLNNMTPAQIKELEQKKMQELDNMTLGQIKELRQKKVQELNGMTLGDLKKKNQELNEMAELLGFVRFAGPNFMNGSMPCRGMAGCPVHI